MWRLKYSSLDSPYIAFVVSRWWRIAPLFVFVQLMAVTLVFTHWMSGDAAYDWRWWVTQPLVISSTWFGKILPPSWSLDVEMQFYLVAPIVIAAMAWGRGERREAGGKKQENASSINRTEPPALSAGDSQRSVTHSRGALEANDYGLQTLGFYAIVVGLIGWCWWRLGNGASLETPSLDLFAWLFLIGITCEQTFWRPSRWLSIVSAFGLILMVIGAAAFPATRRLVWIVGSDKATDSVWGASIFFIATTLVALPFAISTVHQRSSEWDRWIGDLSYPLYLFHWFSRDWYYANVDWSRGPWWNGLLLIVNFLMAFVGAVLLLHFVDRPAQQWRSNWLKTRREQLKTKSI